MGSSFNLGPAIKTRFFPFYKYRIRIFAVAYFTGILNETESLGSFFHALVEWHIWLLQSMYTYVREKYLIIFI